MEPAGAKSTCHGRSTHACRRLGDMAIRPLIACIAVRGVGCRDRGDALERSLPAPMAMAMPALLHALLPNHVPHHRSTSARTGHRMLIGIKATTTTKVIRNCYYNAWP